MRYFLYVLGVVSFLTLLYAGSFLYWQNKFTTPLVSKPLDSQTNPSKPKLNLENTDAITLLFVGDIMLDRGVEWQIQQHANNWLWPFQNIASVLQKADLVFGNLESVISDKGENIGSMYSFRAKPESIQGLTFAGFDVLSVANNHSLDYGRNALLDSIARLQKVGIAPVGAGNNKAEAHAPIIKEIQGTTIAFLAYTALGSPLWEATETGPGVAYLDTLSVLQEDIENTQADIIVVSVHFGEEYQKEPSAWQKLIAHTAIDAGANLVIGHHPHVVQPIEQYQQGYIAYSLGNFVFDQGFSVETMQGLMLQVTIKNKNIMEVTPIPTKISPEFQVSIED